MQQYVNITISTPPLTQTMLKKLYCRFLLMTSSEESFQLTLHLNCIKKLKLRFLESHFNLRKWRTNNQKLHEKINETESILEKVS